MESEIFSTPRGLIQCCDCGCPTCSLIRKPSSTWFRSVKRKFDEFETGKRFYVPEFDLYSNPRVQIENECVALRETVCSQQAAIKDLYAELEKERNASSSAATEAMSMILKLQKQKAEVQMEASQFKRFAEEKMAHDQQEILDLEDLLYKREQAVESLTCEALAYKHRMMSYGLTEAEAEGDKDEEVRSLSMAENFDTQVDIRSYDYPPLKCILNENPGDEVEDVEKCAFKETPNTRERSRDLEQRALQAERNPSSSQMDGGLTETKEVLKKLIVGQSPRRIRHTRRFSTDSCSSFLDKETASEFTISSPRFNIGSPRFNACYKKMESGSKTDEISNSGRMDKTSEVGDHTSDRVYTIDSVHHEVAYNETPEPKPGAGTADEFASTPRGAFNLPGACDPDIKKLYSRLQALEADRESMKRALSSMRTDKAQLVLLKEIAQHLSKEMPSNRQVAKPFSPGSLPFMSVLKVISVYIMCILCIYFVPPGSVVDIPRFIFSIIRFDVVDCVLDFLEAESSPKQIVTERCRLANAFRQGPSAEAVAMPLKHASVIKP
ncbi:Myosin-binding protein 7 [Hibiscus syriacus]|uniref:Myosin-binding protein 7 n=1 Tax=Hibiscus syriacus TaxID=106335 RepID=A0A6A2YMT1_HIBSY|nr:Myosin-binding protein 7 [Hibiscus syriacus]